jgi:hypothetical protein
MAYIKEPLNIDLVVAPTRLTEADKAMISACVAEYKKTSKKPKKKRTMVSIGV